MLKKIKTVFLFIFICSALQAQTEDVLIRADQMPYYPGCGHHRDVEAKRHCSNLGVVAFLSSKLEYPDTAKLQEIEGTVIVSFIVDENGLVIDPYLLRDIGGNCGQEALRVIQLMPKWEPAIHQGKSVKVKLNLPIQFKLKDEMEIASRYKIIWGDLEQGDVSKNELRGNVPNDIIIKDEMGNDVNRNTLKFSYQKKKKYLEEGSNGTVTKDMRKLVRKVRKGGVFTLTVTIQDDGELIDLEKQFSIIN